MVLVKLPVVKRKTIVSLDVLIFWYTVNAQANLLMHLLVKLPVGKENNSSPAV